MKQQEQGCCGPAKVGRSDDGFGDPEKVIVFNILCEADKGA